MLEANPHPRSSSLMISRPPSEEQQLSEQPPHTSQSSHHCYEQHPQRSRCQLRSSCCSDHLRINCSPSSHCHQEASLHNSTSRSVSLVMDPDPMGGIWRFLPCLSGTPMDQYLVGGIWCCPPSLPWPPMDPDPKGAVVGKLRLASHIRLFGPLSVALPQNTMAWERRSQLLELLGIRPVDHSATLTDANLAVINLGHSLLKFANIQFQEKRRLGTERKQAVYAIPVLCTWRQIWEFLGAAGFCQIWISGFSDLANPLYEALKGEEKSPINWGPKQEKAFISIKAKLTEAPALGLPGVTRDFNLFVHENSGVALGVLTQEVGPWQRPVAYLSKQIDPVASGWPPCLRALAATALLVKEADKLTLEQNLNVKVPHAVVTLMEARRALLMARGKGIKNQNEILKLLEAVLEPKEIADTYCKGHQKGKDTYQKEINVLTLQLSWLLKNKWHRHRSCWPHNYLNLQNTLLRKRNGPSKKEERE
ncbi:hypothetical protein QTO34_000741 [Cnephaeus nilssonii]|uniref:Reverse transcriptase/retrotransposon-derived protein RNase H-like domain-containing protein n=1 Tax=Cnephaeus nilssonii TaxID=3371016 RepID=A0AA40ICT0_CNENI|nr:hypothetical protein QTO34_000741 [Eptesicus nilssonii]